MSFYFFCMAIPITCFVSHAIARPTHFFGKVKKKNSESLVKLRSKYFTLQAHDLVLLTPIVTPRNQASCLEIWCPFQCSV